LNPEFTKLSFASLVERSNGGGGDKIMKGDDLIVELDATLEDYICSWEVP